MTPIKLYKDLSVHLYEGEAAKKRGAPTPPQPITYLTQWKIVGNSEVHTLPYPDGVVLPTGYKRCKYLEFHGTEYIESGIASKEGIGITCRFKTTTAEKFLFGVRNGNNQDITHYKSSFALYTKANSRALIGYGSSLQEVSDVNIIDGVEHTLQLDDTIAKVDNTDITFTRETIVTSWNIPIGAAKTGGVIDERYYVGYLYSFVLYDANSTLFNGIPCLDDNNVPCLYDTISGTSFYNNGTGTLGYELYPQPTEIWSCGEPITESLTLFDGTQELLDGFLPTSGAYPTTNSSYPNAKYYVFDVKAGYTITNNIGINTRLRLIVNENVYQNININSDNAYLISTYDPVSNPNGYVYIRQDCKIGLLVLDSTQSYAGSITASYIKYHILVQPLGGSIADIALNEPLRKVNDVVDTIEFPSDTEGKALVTRKNIFIQKLFNNGYFDSSGTVFISAFISDDIAKTSYFDRFTISICNKLETSYMAAMQNANMVAMGTYNGSAIFRNYEIEQTADAYKAWLATLGELDLICQLATPTTELVDAPQIEEADSYSMVISQDAKAVSWSSFETE